MDVNAYVIIKKFYTRHYTLSHLWRTHMSEIYTVFVLISFFKSSLLTAFMRYIGNIGIISKNMYSYRGYRE